MGPWLDFLIFMLFACVYSIAAIAWSAAVVYLFKTIAHRRSRISLWSAALAYTPLNLVFRPDLLTERGLQYRLRFGVAVLIFVCAVAAGLVLTGILGLLS
jgi:hypothetical protein